MNILESLRLAYEYLSRYAGGDDIDGCCRECGAHLAYEHSLDCYLGHALEGIAKAIRPLESPEDYPEEAAAVREFVEKRLS